MTDIKNYSLTSDMNDINNVFVSQKNGKTLLKQIRNIHTGKIQKKMVGGSYGNYGSDNSMCGGKCGGKCRSCRKNSSNYNKAIKYLTHIEQYIKNKDELNDVINLKNKFTKSLENQNGGSYYHFNKQIPCLYGGKKGNIVGMDDGINIIINSNNKISKSNIRDNLKINKNNNEMSELSINLTSDYTSSVNGYSYSARIIN
jgi:hypothetical protein